MGPLHELFREEQVYSLRDCPSTSMLHQMFYAFKLRQPSPFLPLSFIILHYALLSSPLSYYFTCLQIDKEDVILQRAKSPPADHCIPFMQPASPHTYSGELWGKIFHIHACMRVREM